MEKLEKIAQEVPLLQLMRAKQLRYNASTGHKYTLVQYIVKVESNNVRRNNDHVCSGVDDYSNIK